MRRRVAFVQSQHQPCLLHHGEGQPLSPLPRDASSTLRWLLDRFRDNFQNPLYAPCRRRHGYPIAGTALDSIALPLNPDSRLGFCRHSSVSEQDVQAANHRQHRGEHSQVNRK